MLSSGAVPAQVSQASPGPRWTALERWAFRVAFVYFTLDALPDLLLRFPGGPLVLSLYWKIWNPVLPWFGRYVVHARNPQDLPLPTVPVLLGDFSGGYVLMLLFLLLGIAIAFIWGLADRRRANYQTLHYWLRAYVRYALACSMLGYGFGKLFPLQFGSLGLVDLLTPVGMLEPRRLLWDFMGFSRSYQVFTGLVECIGAGLLFWRRTTLLGSLLLIGAMANVLMIDIGYGMSVRRIALRLLLLAVFLAGPDLRRLTKFLLHLPTEPAQIRGPSWTNVWIRRSALAVKTVVVLYVVISQLREDMRDPRLVAAPRPALYGVYKVQQFLSNGREDSPGNSKVWQWVAIDKHGMAVQLSSLNWEQLSTVFDDAKQSITISNGPRQKSSLTYARTNSDDVLIHGVLNNKSTEILLRRVPEPLFPLNEPGSMHWPSIW